MLGSDISQPKLFVSTTVADFVPKSHLLREKKRKLLSDEHFSVDGTLIEAWASHKSFRAKDDDDEGGGTGGRRRTLGADKGYDTADFVAGCRELTVTPHVAQNDSRRGGSAIDGRTTSQAGE